MRVGLSVAAVAAPAAAFACSPSDIEMKQADLVRQEPSRYLLAVGEFVNNCADPVFVQFHITVRDRNGRVVASNDRWPAGVDPVPAHSSYAFDLNAADEPDTRHAVQSMTIDIVGARTDGPYSGPPSRVMLEFVDVVSALLRRPCAAICEARRPYRARPSFRRGGTTSADEASSLEPSFKGRVEQRAQVSNCPPRGAPAPPRERQRRGRRGRRVRGRQELPSHFLLTQLPCGVVVRM